MVLFMNKRKVFLLLIFLVMMSLVAGIVVAQQSIDSAFERISNSFKGFSPAKYYDAAPYFFDAVFLFWILLTITSAVLSGQWEGRGSKVAIAFAAVATAGSVIALNRFDRTLLGDGGPILLTFLMFVSIVSAMRSEMFKENKALFAFAFLLLYFGITRAFPEVGELLEGIPFLGPVISIALVIAFLVALFGLLGAAGIRTPKTGEVGSAAERAGEYWPASLWRRAKKGKDITENPQAHNLAQAQQSADVAEIRVESDLLKLLNRMNYILSRLNKGQTSEDDIKYLVAAMNAIKTNIHKLNNLNHREANEEKLLEKGKSKNSKIAKLLKGEVLATRRLNREITLLDAALKETPIKFAEARTHINNAKQIVAWLASINNKQIHILES